MCKHLLASVHAFRAWCNVLQKSVAARLEELWTFWQGFFLPKLKVCQAFFHHCRNSVFVQTRQCGEGRYVNCFQFLHKRLSIRSCNCSEVYLWPFVMLLSWPCTPLWVYFWRRWLLFLQDDHSSQEVNPSMKVTFRNDSATPHQGEVLDRNCDFDVMFPHSAMFFSKDISDPPIFPVA